MTIDRNRPDPTKDTTPATRGFVYEITRTAADLVKEIYGERIKALERRVAELEEEATRP